MSAETTAASERSSLIQKLIERGNGVHAVLLYGAQGSCATTIAEALAAAWLCQNPGPAGACGECPVCRSYEAGRAVDLLRVVPTGASRVIKNHAIVGGDPKDTGLPLVDFVRTGTLAARYKVVIIQDADRMNASAANGLLKTLEEPGPHLKLILTTQQISSILPTVLSRCVAIPCALATDHELLEEFGAMEEFERVFSERSREQMLAIRKRPERYRELWVLLESLRELPIGAALRAAERFRKCAESFDSEEFGGVRAANSEAVRLVAVWLRYRYPHRPDALVSAVEAHRRIVGNANVGAQTDPLFCQILSSVGLA